MISPPWSGVVVGFVQQVIVSTVSENGNTILNQPNQLEIKVDISVAKQSVPSLPKQVLLVRLLPEAAVPETG